METLQLTPVRVNVRGVVYVIRVQLGALKRRMKGRSDLRGRIFWSKIDPQAGL